MRVTITGARGQLGSELVASLGLNHLVQGLAKPEHDVTSSQITSTIVGFSPDVVIHCAAYTNVDGCELHPAEAYAVNAEGTRNVAMACRETGAAMVYVSTNYVFDGTKDAPYAEEDPTGPISVYGRSKLAGEEVACSLLERFYIVRTAWLYGAAGRNFVKSILSLAEANDKLRVVADQFASPTYAVDLAGAIERLISRPVCGIYHFTNSGRCSWYEWASAILRIARKGEPPVVPIPAEEYVRPAQPPRFSVMGNNRGADLGITLRPWEEALRDFLTTRPTE